MDLVESFFDDTADCARFVSELKEMGRTSRSRECVAMLVKESQNRWLFTLTLRDGMFVCDYVSPFDPTEENVFTFNRATAELSRRLRIYAETNDPEKTPKKPPPFGHLTHPDGLYPEWIQVHSFGESKVYVDRASIINLNSGALAWVRYELNPPGLDKLNQKQTPEMWLCEEYDFSQGKVRTHRIIFTYMDQSRGEPVRPIAEWQSATDGSRITLNFLRSVTNG